MRFLIAGPALAVLLACQHDAPAPPKAPVTRAVSGLEDPVDSVTGLATSCEFIATEAHPDPAQLIQEFVEHDAAGDFLESNPWFDGAAECPGHVSGWDAHAIITSYQVRPFLSGTSYASAIVTYKQAGTVSGTTFRLDTATFQDTISVHRTAFGWRVAVPMFAPHVAYRSALAKGEVTADDTLRISEMMPPR